MTVKIMTGDCLELLRTLPEGSVHCCVTSPPYFGLRDYGHAGQIGLEPTPDEYVAKLVEVFRQVRRVLRDDGTVWLNLGDSYSASRSYQVPDSKHRDVGNSKGMRAGSPDKNGGNSNRDGVTNADRAPKNLLGIPWRVAFALQADGWYLRSDIIWQKPNPMPESVTDRPTKAHEYLFLLAKQERYYYDAAAIAEPFAHPQMQEEAKRRKSNGETREGRYMVESGRNDAGGYTGGMGFASYAETRNRRTVWTVATQPYSGAHFATFPPDLIEPCIKAGCPEGGMVLDPFGGAGTTGLVADRLQRNALLIELNPEYVAMAEARIRNDAPLFAQVNA